MSPAAKPRRDGAHGLRAGVFAARLFLVLLAYYQIKPASRSLFLEHFGTERLPWVWIASAVALGLLMPIYHALAARVTRPTLVSASLVLFALGLVAFRLSFAHADAALAAAFYVYADLLSVVLVEQAWSLVNGAHTTHEARRWYGWIGIGGLLGGTAGGALAAFLVTHTAVATFDLTLVAAAILLAVGMLDVMWHRRGLYEERPAAFESGEEALQGWRTVRHSGYLALIAALLLLAQLIEPIVEYQFMDQVAQRFPEREARTAWLGGFFGALGAVAIGVNFVLTPLVLRHAGTIAGLLVQPVTVILATVFYMGNTTLFSAAALKIADRGMSYSINRAAKELLYVPVDPVRVHQAKAWIDMFGYRLFKVAGALAILALTQWPWQLAPASLGTLSFAISAAWILLLAPLGRRYARRIGGLPAC